MKKAIALVAIMSGLGAVAPAGTSTRCRDATTTRDIEQCVSAELKEAEALLERYLTEATRQVSDNPNARDSLEAAQAAWAKYESSHCIAVYKLHSPGSGAALQMGECKLALVQRRTHEVWETYVSNRTSPLTEPTQ